MKNRRSRILVTFVHTFNDWNGTQEISIGTTSFTSRERHRDSLYFRKQIQEVIKENLEGYNHHVGETLEIIDVKVIG